jgi:hypothetical protein
MAKSTYLKNYAESFAIFAKYEPSAVLELDFCSIRVALAEPVTPEDYARLRELGWAQSEYGDYFKDERGMGGLI